ncbi:MAG: glycosyltransferase [Gemmatimonadota bacterium]|nr:glycosyltransferase [Gemmatimonadota bacterium]MDQ8147959.1 glycosyltransferase [Gemmatimonadota bacterium]MDQ8149636.1 glycosyltransferase [Gemmatimonadota bacterium]MDQ8177300.1 glycosyltransferase [Gemmatimonadota bacterium]
MSDETIDIICAARDAAPFVDEAIASVVQQSHAAWRLWLRDDGSADDTAARLAAWAARDPRIHLLHRGAPALGAAQAFGWLLARLDSPTDTPSPASWIACLDADDRWHPDRLAVTLAAGRAAGDETTPTLVHSDCRLIDTSGATLHPSYWAAAGLRPDPTDVRRLAIQNVATGSTLLLNRALVRAIGRVPPEAMHQDWWFALVAAVTGRVIAVHRPLVDYRQHGSNTVGATAGALRGATDLWHRARAAGGRTARLRSDLARSGRQAGALALRYAPYLSPDQRTALTALAALPTLPLMPRKLALLRHRLLPEHGLLRNLGVLLRG